MSQFVAPGVYVIERDFSDYVASLQATSVGMVGTAKKGPLNVPTLCTTPEQFLSTFGEPTSNMYGPFAALNYLRKGNQLWYNRVARVFTEDFATLNADTALGATALTLHSTTGIVVGNYIRIRQTGKATTVAKVSAVGGPTALTIATGTIDAYTNSDTSDCTIDLNDTTTDVLAANQAEVFGYTRINGVPTKVVKFTAVDPGKWANFGTKAGIEIVIEDSGQFTNTDPITGVALTDGNSLPLQGVVTTAPSVDTKAELLAIAAANTKVGELRGVNYDSLVFDITNAELATNVATLTMVSTTGLNVGDQITVDISNNTFDGSYAITAKTGTTISYAKTNADIPSAAVTGTITVTSGSHKGTVYRCTALTTPPTWVAVGLLTKRVKVFYQGRQVEVFDNLIGYDAASPNYWDTVIGNPSGEKISNYIYAEYVGATGEQPVSTYNKVKHPYNPRLLMGLSTSVKDTATVGSASTLFANAAGADGENPGSAEYIGTIDEAGVHTGLQSFRKNNEFDINLLCVPAVTLAEVLNEVLSICEERNDCLGILDTPFGLTVQEAVDWHNGTGPYTGLHSAFVSNRAAMYYPWVQTFDPYTQREIWLPPSAVVPAVIANNDAVGEIWFAPAGVNRGHVFDALKVEHNVSQGEMDYMYGPGNGNALNPIVGFATDGITVWGQRTLQRVPTALDRINVRRMLFFVEKAIATSVRRLTFEQDDPILWSRFRALVEPFMQSLVGRRALEDFRVVCDESTNPPERRNNNEMGAKLLLIPVKSAEKIVLDFTLMASGASFDELIEQA